MKIDNSYKWSSKSRLRGRIHGKISARAEISAWLLGDGKEGGNVLNKKHEVWNTESAL